MVWIWLAAPWCGGVTGLWNTEIHTHILKVCINICSHFSQRQNDSHISYIWVKQPKRAPSSLGKTKLEPLSIVILSVVMSLASVEMIKESIEKIVRYVDDPDGGPVVRLPTILICVVTIGKSYVQMNSRKEFLRQHYFWQLKTWKLTWKATLIYVFKNNWPFKPD